MTEQPFDPGQAPSHPDYIRMVELVSEMEQAIEGGGDSFNIQAYLAQYADPHSVGYIALQRAMGLLEFETPEDLMGLMPELMRLSMLYTEGFILGAVFEQTQTPNDRALAETLANLQGESDGTD